MSYVSFGSVLSLGVVWALASSAIAQDAEVAPPVAPTESRADAPQANPEAAEAPLPLDSNALVALPQERLVRGIHHALSRGDLIQANVILDAAFAHEPISRVELRELYGLRALLAYADQRLGQMEESLAGLATLSDDPVEGFPPPLRERLVEVQETTPPLQLRLELASEVHDDMRSVRPVPRTVHDRGRLVRHVRIFAATDDGPLRLLGNSETLTLGDPHEEHRVRYALEALGVGGALLHTLGDRDNPLTLRVEPLPKDRTYLWVAIGTVAGFVVLSAIAFGFAWVLTDGFTQGQPTVIDEVSCCS